jgi:hypothetical protein
MAALDGKSVKLTEPEIESLAQQIGQLNTPLSRRHHESALANPRLDAVRAEVASHFASRQAPKGEGSVLEYSDGFQAQFDTLLLSSEGDNQPVVFLTDPPLDVLAGDTYTYQAIAADPDSEGNATFAKIAGPAALTVSPSGLVQWGTSTDEGGIHDVEIEATDFDGAKTRQAWKVTVGNARLPVSLRFRSPRSVDVVPGQTYFHTPVVEGLFLNDDPGDITAITFDLLDAPLGATIEPFTGQITWATTEDDRGSHQFIVRVRQQLGSTTQVATQTMFVNVEDSTDGLLGLSENFKAGWLLR